MNLTSIEQLMIRACKSGNAQRRLEKIVRVNYLSSISEQDFHKILILKLGSICDALGMTTLQLINDVERAKSMDGMLRVTRLNYQEYYWRQYVSFIANTTTEDLKKIGYIVPARWRNKS